MIGHAQNATARWNLQSCLALARSATQRQLLEGSLTVSGLNPLYALAGFMVGALVGVTGVGGGSLMTPILVLLFGFHPSTAVGTDLLYASMTKTVGTAVHGRRQTVDWSVVGRLATGSVPASLATLLVLSRSGKLDAHSSAVLAYLLGAALVLTGVAVMFQPRIVRWARPALEQATNRQIVLLTVLLGAVLGVLVSLTSVGAGALGVTVLLILYPHLPVARIAGSDIAHAVPLTLIAGMGHLWLGDVDFGLMLNLLAGSIPGIVVGSLLGSRSPDKVLRPVLAVTLLVVGGRLVLA